jgi:hypothetical protein
LPVRLLGYLMPTLAPMLDAPVPVAAVAAPDAVTQPTP